MILKQFVRLYARSQELILKDKDTNSDYNVVLFNILEKRIYRCANPILRKYIKILRNMYFKNSYTMDIGRTYKNRISLKTGHVLAINLYNTHVQRFNHKNLYRFQNRRLLKYDIYKNVFVIQNMKNRQFLKRSITDYLGNLITNINIYGSPYYTIYLHILQVFDDMFYINI